MPQIAIGSGDFGSTKTHKETVFQQSWEGFGLAKAFETQIGLFRLGPPCFAADGGVNNPCFIFILSWKNPGGSWRYVEMVRVAGITMVTCVEGFTARCIGDNSIS